LTAERLEATCAPARALRAKTAELAEMADIVRTSASSEVYRNRTT
jgi:hypothetical protein